MSVQVEEDCSDKSPANPVVGLSNISLLWLTRQPELVFQQFSFVVV
jgi:hypothetical protein